MSSANGDSNNQLSGAGAPDVKGAFKRAAFYAGSFNPVTLGHIDVIKHASKMTDHLVVGVGKNISKDPLFTPEERADMIRRDIEKYVQPELDRAGNPCKIEVVTYEGATADFMKANGISVYFRGIRGVKDFNDEENLAAVNADLYNDGEFDGDVQNQFTQTLIYSSNPDLRKVSSSTVRELGSLGQDQAMLRYVSPQVMAELLIRMDQKGMRPGAENRYKIPTSDELQFMKDIWDDITQGFNRDMADQIWAEIIIRHSEPHRMYHNAGHLYEVLKLWDENKAALKYPAKVALGLFFHDVIYDPSSTTNEVDSGEYALDALWRMGSDSATAARVQDLVKMTQDHNPRSGDNDAAYMMDIDMAILGAQPDQYNDYVSALRVEYGAAYTEQQFNEGRLSLFIEPLASQQRLFHTDKFQNRYGAQAASNIAQEGDVLRKLLSRPGGPSSSQPK